MKHVHEHFDSQGGISYLGYCYVTTLFKTIFVIMLICKFEWFLPSL